MLLRVLVLIFFLKSTTVGFTQKVIINGKEENRLLRWDDFTGKPNKSSIYHAYTYWNVSAKFDNFIFAGDTAKLKVVVVVELKENSWKKKNEVTDTLY
jgi:hypothetical protein